MLNDGEFVSVLDPPFLHSPFTPILSFSIIINVHAELILFNVLCSIWKYESAVLMRLDTVLIQYI